AVTAWRKAAPAAVDAPLIATDEGLEAVIERRVSTRRFRKVPLSRSEFDRLVTTAEAPLEADFRRLTKLQALVHAVEGLPPGVYDVTGGEPVLRRAGTLRKEAAHAALDQAAAGDAAVDFYFVADLDAVLDALGERGYRAAQLEGGVRGGLVYLQATALGLGATGLTFYDDEAAALLGLGEAGAVLFLAAVGRYAT
ncbi:MAG TPA: nitroreductase family protein, partial [Dehalococcoidia bacterium]|nr:nitroreductase family protein [Dehalococcoidia bacterium]